MFEGFLPAGAVVDQTCPSCRHGCCFVVVAMSREALSALIDFYGDLLLRLAE